MVSVNSIAIVTLYDNINIGNKLQNYALQELLKQYAHTVTTLTYSEARQLVPLMSWKGKIIVKIGFPKSAATKRRAILKRYDKLLEFSNKYIKTEKEKRFVEHDHTENEKYDCFVVGSDQVWHNFTNTKEEVEYFFLSFADENKRICFSPSLGMNSIPEMYKDLYISGLNSFKYLSCREKNGCDLFSRLTGREIALLPDPTLCLSKSEWKKIEKKPEYEVPENFILAYFLGEKDAKVTEEINKYAQENNYLIIDVFDILKPEYYTTSPDEFLYLIDRASCVMTNSFHGCVFSIIYHKRFKVYNRIDGDGKMMGARFETLFETIDTVETQDGFLQATEFSNGQISMMQTKARDYLNQSIRGINA